MNTDIGVSNPALDLYLPIGCCGERELRVSVVYLWRRCAHECVGNRVLAWIAAFQMSKSVVGMAGQPMMLMGCQPVVVLGMIVIVVNVSV